MTSAGNGCCTAHLQNSATRSFQPAISSSRIDYRKGSFNASKETNKRTNQTPIRANSYANDLVKERHRDLQEDDKVSKLPFTSADLPCQRLRDHQAGASRLAHFAITRMWLCRFQRRNLDTLVHYQLQLLFPESRAPHIFFCFTHSADYWKTRKK
jgi:hypothetical protein